MKRFMIPILLIVCLIPCFARSYKDISYLRYDDENKIYYNDYFSIRIPLDFRYGIINDDAEAPEDMLCFIGITNAHPVSDDKTVGVFIRIFDNGNSYLPIFSKDLFKENNVVSRIYLEVQGSIDTQTDYVEFKTYNGEKFLSITNMEEDDSVHIYLYTISEEFDRLIAVYGFFQTWNPEAMNYFEGMMESFKCIG